MGQVLFILLILSISPLHASDVPRCTVRDLIHHHLSVFPNGKTAVKVPSGGGIVHPYVEADRHPMERAPVARQRNLKDIPPMSKSEVIELAEEIRDAFINDLTKDKEEENWTQDERLMVNRLLLVPINLEECDNAEASFSHQRFSIRLCTNARKTPKLALAFTIAHELGHVIDPCNLESKFYQTLKAVREDASALDLSQNTSGLFLDTILFRTEGPNPLPELLTSKKVKMIDEGIRREKNPSYEALRCLANEHRSYPKFPANATESLCQGSAFTEAGAQVLGARVMRRWMKTRDLTNPIERLALFANSLPSYKSDHPSGKELDVDLLLLTDPELQKAFACAPVSRKDCLK